MSMSILSLIFDIAVLACLAYTIYFALRLSKSLNNFKNNRKELRTLIETLSGNIEKAENAVKTLKQDSYETADELRGLIRESKSMTAELGLVNDAADNLAGRLEGLAQRTPKSPQKKKSSVDMDEWFGAEDDIVELTDPFSEDDLEEGQGGYTESPFSIHDPEFEEDNFQDNDFKSAAERDLYEALEQKRKVARG